MKFFHILLVILLLFGLADSGHAGESDAMPWDVPALTTAPQIYDDPAHSTDDVKAVFYEGLPWKGKPTRVFAYYGIPKVAAGTKVPAMVLVHGGGGSAYQHWVRLWVSRGYAAIAMDTCGSVSGGKPNSHTRHDFGGPPGWGGFEQLDDPVEDQWTYHAVADVILAHSLIRSFPEVDAEKVGLTGISWGGYLACIVAGVDHRFKLAAPVYGCGFLQENSTWLPDFQAMGEAKSEKWRKRWDPSQYLSQAKMPMLWVSSPTDFAFPLDSLRKSFRQVPGSKTLSIHVGMPHGDFGPGENPPEIHALADALLRNGSHLPKILETGRDGDHAWVTFESSRPVVKAELNYTLDEGDWQKRNWKMLPASLDKAAMKAAVDLPKGVVVYYFNIVDERDLVVSSEYVESLP
jgi:dienelactone hydrolase